MNGVVEARVVETGVVETKTKDKAVEVVVVVTTTTTENLFEDLVRRCRELLAKQQADDGCPPGHWLG